MANRPPNFLPGTSATWPGLPVRRADLHCHSNGSNAPGEAVLKAIDCPESYSDPKDVYDQARRRGMDFVTITDHDSLRGIVQLTDRPNHFSGEELTCYFPEDGCKMHILVWGLTDRDHADLQAAAADIYKVAELIEDRQLAHSVAHPVYRQNDRLERWHLERLVLLFKGFETLNGSHSVLHRQSLEPLLDSLTADTIAEYAERHGLHPRWPDPQIKSRTGGSDDHGLFNIGRTWTEFPGDVQTPAQILECLRTARCRPGGEAGSSLKLAHNFYGVGIRYYGRRIARKSSGKSLSGMMLGALVGDQGKMRRRDWAKAVVRSKARKIGKRLLAPFRPKPKRTGTALLLDLFLASCKRRLGEQTGLRDAISSGHAVLGEHEAMFQFISAVNRDISGGIADSVKTAFDRKEIVGVFDAISTVAAHQFVLLPYYFALFHQNRERQLLPRITGVGAQVTGAGMKLGVFTDTFDEINGVSRVIHDFSRQAREHHRDLTVYTCTDSPTVDDPTRKNFKPLLSRPLPYYADQPLTIPPLAEVLEWADRQQFDAIHVHTPGPMGIVGWLVSRMLRVPLLGTYHTDLPGYVKHLTGDHRSTSAATAFMKWFYGQTATTFSRSKEYHASLIEMGLPEKNLTMTLPGVDNEKFHPRFRDLSIWERLGVKQSYKLFYAGRVSVEKNLPFLGDTFKRICKNRPDVALVIAGDGPYLANMKKALAGLPVYFLGYQTDTTLPTLYASSDLFVFPSETDTLGQAVIEAQAAGLPVLVSNKGGPQEVMDDGISGLVIPAENSAQWEQAIVSLLDDTPRRQRMSRTAFQRMKRFSMANAFENFWEGHVTAANARQITPPIPAQMQNS